MRLKNIKENKKIVIAIITLIIVLTISVSYAYFTLKVKGNEEAKKIKVQSGTMSLKLDGTTITSLENALPGATHTINFTVENTGTLDTIYNLDMIEIINTYEKKEELEYKIERDNKEVKEYSQAPESGSETILGNIGIKSKEKHSYTLTIHFKEIGSNQNYNQGRVFSGKVQINNASGNLRTILAHNTIKEETPDFSKGYPSVTDKDNSKSGIYIASDDQGESYYFRGDKNLLNNNIEFAGKKWKIVRINGDGTVRLILNDKIDTDSKFNDYTAQNEVNAGKYTGYTYDNTNSCTKNNPCEVIYKSGEFSNENFGGQDSNIKTALETWYSNNLNSVNDQIAQGYFCNDTSYGSGTEGVTTSGYLYYGAYDRVLTKKQPSLKCPEPNNKSGEPRDYGGIYKTKIGLITADELNMAGLSWYEPYADKTNYLYHNYYWWNLSPRRSNANANVFGGSYGNIDDGSGSTYRTGAVVPVINLSTNALITTGDGSESNPFVLSLN